MSWGKKMYDAIFSDQQALLDETILKHRSEISLAIKEMLIRTEIMKRDFTKRQLNILCFVLNLSYQCGKDFAVIPKMIDFQLCGISATKIKQELKQLEEMKVLNWDKTINTFTINDPKLWENPLHVGYSRFRMTDLYHLNMKHTGIDITPVVTKLKYYGYL